MADNNTKMNISYTIKAIDRFSKVHKKLEKQIDRIEKTLKDLPDSTDIKIDVNATKAKKDLDDVKDKADKIPKFKVFTLITKGFKDARRQMDRVADFSRDMGEIMQGFGTGALLTVLAPALEVLVGGLGAVASSAGSAALGLGGLAAVAIPAIADITGKYGELKDAREALAEAKTEEEIEEATEKLTEAQSKFTKEQLKSAEAMEQFGKFYKKFSKQFEKPILDVFNRSLGTAQALLEILKPAIDGVAEATSDLLTSFNENLNADDVQAFFDWVGDTAGPNLEKLTQAVGNFLAGFGNMLVAFDPLAQSFLEGLLEMSESFREWTSALEENQAFQDFMSTVQENAPVVLELIGQLTQALWYIIEAMSPFAGEIIKIVNGLLEWFNGLMETNEAFSETIGFIATAISVLTMIFAPIMILANLLKSLLVPAFGFLAKMLSGKVVGWLVKVGLRLTSLANPVGIAIAAITLLAGIFDISMADIWNFTKTAFSKVASYVTEKVGVIKENVAEGWANMVENVSTMGSTMGANIREGWENIKKNISNAVSDAYKSVANGFTDMIDGVVEWMSGIKSSIESGWEDAQSYLEGISLYDIGVDIISGLAEGISKSVGKVTGAIGSVVSEAISWARKKLDSHSPSRVFIGIGNDTGEGLAIGIEDKIRRVSKASASMVGASIPTINSRNFQGINSESAPNRFGASVVNTTTSGDTYDFARMNEGATFVIREEADVEKLSAAFGKQVKKVKRVRGQR